MEKERTIEELAAENEALRAELERVQHQNDMLRKAVFGPKSERRVLADSSTDSEQMSFFNEAETEARREESESVTVPEHKRKKNSAYPLLLLLLLLLKAALLLLLKKRANLMLS